MSLMPPLRRQKLGIDLCEFEYNLVFKRKKKVKKEAHSTGPDVITMNSEWLSNHWNTVQFT